MEIYNLGMTGQVIKDLLGTVQSNAVSWSQGATIATQALRYTTQELGPDKQEQARLNIDAQKKIFQYVACTATTTTITYTGFAIGAMGADMSTTTNFGVVLGIPNFWDVGKFKEGETQIYPSAPGFGAVAFGASTARGALSISGGGGRNADFPTNDNLWKALWQSFTGLNHVVPGVEVGGEYSVGLGTHIKIEDNCLNMFAYGMGCYASNAKQGVIEGYMTAILNNGAGQHVEGNLTFSRSPSQGGHTEGRQCVNETGLGAHVEGYGGTFNSSGITYFYLNKVAGSGAHAQGIHTIASGNGAFSGGYGLERDSVRLRLGDTTTISNINTAISLYYNATLSSFDYNRNACIAHGTAAFSHGLRTWAIGNAAIALGRETTASQDQMVIGQQNYILPNIYQFIVGKGGAKNNLVLKGDGTLFIRGNLYVNSTDDSCIANGQLVATQNWVGNNTLPKILNYEPVSSTVGATTYTGFAVGAVGANMTNTTKFGFVFGVPNYWSQDFEQEKDSELNPSAPGFNAVALGAAIANGDFSLAAGGGNAGVNAPYTDWTNKCPETTAYTKNSFIGARTDGKYAFAQGTHVIANGPGAFARGSIILAMGKHSTGIGNDILTTINAEYAMGQGYGLIVDGKSQFVHGQWNYPLGSGYLEVVGYTSATQHLDSVERRNIYTLDTQGNIHIRGRIYQNCTDESCTTGYDSNGITLWTNSTPKVQVSTATWNTVTTDQLKYYKHYEIEYMLDSTMENSVYLTTRIRIAEPDSDKFSVRTPQMLLGGRASSASNALYRRQWQQITESSCVFGNAYYNTSTNSNILIPQAIYLVP